MCHTKLSFTCQHAGFRARGRTEPAMFRPLGPFPRFVFSVSVAFLVVGMEYLMRKSLGERVCSTYAGRGHSPPWWREPRQLVPFSVCRLAVKRDECARSVDFHLSLSLRPQPTDTVRVGLPTQMLPCIPARKALVEICLPGDSTAYQLVDQY